MSRAAAHEGGNRKGAMDGALVGGGEAAAARATSGTKPDAISAEAAATLVDGALSEGRDLE